MSYNSLLGRGTHSQADCQLQWELDEAGTTAADTSGNGFDGTSVASSTAVTTGGAEWLANARNYTGSTGSYTVGSNQPEYSFERTDAFSLAFWASIDSSAGTILSKMDALNNFRGYDIYLDSATGFVHFNLISTVSTNAINVTSTASQFSTGSFFHGLVTYDGSVAGAGVNMYVDGSSVATTVNIDNLSATTITSAVFRAGGRTAGSGGSVPYDGKASDICVFDAELSSADAAELYGGPEPLNTVAPALSGTEVVGSDLTCSTGTWDSQNNGTVTYAYQWTRSDDAGGTGEADIAGATSSTYTLVTADTGKFIRCRVRGSNDGGFDSAEDTNSDMSGAISPTITITADYGSFTLTGQDATFSDWIVADRGSYLLSGQDASLDSALKLVVDEASFVLSGQAATFEVGRIIDAERGSFVLSGQDITRNLRLIADSGSFSLAGQDADIRIDLTAEYGSFSLSGQEATLGIFKHIDAERGSFTLSGQTATFSRELKLIAAEGLFVLSGQEASINILVDISLSADVGSFVLDGQETGFVFPDRSSERRFGFVVDGYRAILLGV